MPDILQANPAPGTTQHGDDRATEPDREVFEINLDYRLKAMTQPVPKCVRYLARRTAKSEPHMIRQLCHQIDNSSEGLWRALRTVG